MQECNLKCRDCESEYYSASPKYAAELMNCQKCGGSNVVMKGENSAQPAHEGGSSEGSQGG